ncbi:hypothetical protein TEA_022746 [Camellia sinensis var. sinensis]|uniref:Leucine-rich repeat-containing N-terminal plant-type domain-containing protein n=1 Tax=Camellia sinensis var. sinensis TaxID=542762 RepID=A0A4S4F031_CAMSN|nr:hypothetical protein TEA_022746 [Camellia sinensis var. sinensis]
MRERLNHVLSTLPKIPTKKTKTETETEQLYSSVNRSSSVSLSHSTITSCCLEEEKNTLLQIRDSMLFSMDNQPVSFFSSLDIDDCCRWDGVDCSLTTNRVTRIFLHYTRDNNNYNAVQLSWSLDLSLIAQLQELQHLELRGSRIGSLVAPEGPVPLSSFAHLSKLRFLDLSYNPLIQVNTETPAWQPSFQLQHLFLAGCNLNHQSNDHGIPSFILTQHTLQTLDLSSNSLTGSIPVWMLHNVSSVLRLRSNMFSGNFPQGYRNDASPLVELDISCNHFEGPLPLNIDTLFPKLYNFNVSTNRLNGTIPPSLGELTNLHHLDLSNNQLVGKVPRHLTENSSLWYLNLSNNSLQGELLPQGCNMKQLRWFLVRNNHFIGSMPSCLSNSPSLSILDAGINNLSGIISNQLPTFPHLGALLLGGNQFEGHIPMQLCQMKNIQFLDLSNNFFLGNIPPCLNNNLVWRRKFQSSSWVPIDFTTKGNSYSFQGLPLTLMTGIDLSANHLSGIIPPEIGELHELHSLNFSHNHLTGLIPTSFENLTNLGSLDLSYNNLTGKIPREIGQINFLSVFSVAFNNLSGRIPFGQQLCTFTEHAYIGNPNLCGEPLQRPCSPEHQDPDDNSKDHKKEERHMEEDGIIDEPLFFYSCVAISYVLGFWSVVAPLFISKSWQRRYYAAVDEYIDMFLLKLYLIHDMLLCIYRN